MPPVRCALFGMGMLGSLHARILATTPAAELVVICDIDPAVAARIPTAARLHRRSWTHLS